MVSEWALQALSAVVSWLLGILPAPTVPAWFAGAPGQIQDVMADVASFGNWLPIALVIGVMVTFFAVVLAGLAIKLVRIVASFLTAGGGSAA